MAFTVTARQSGNSLTTSSQTKATGSATPTANSLFLVLWASEHDTVATAPSFQTPTGGSLTYTQVAKAGDTTSYPWNGDDSFRVGGAVYRAPIGGSPSAFAVTVDSFSGTQVAWYAIVCLDITGHDTTTPIVGTPAFSGASKSGGNAETGTVVLGATPTAGNLIVVMFAAGADGGGGFASPTAGAGKTFTTVTNQTTANCQLGVFYRVADGTESTTITCSDLGQAVGNYTAIAFEVAAASGGGSNLTLTPSDTEGLTDSAAFDVAKILADSEGLTDSAALAVGKAFSDAENLTDSSVLEIGHQVTAADTEGLIDSSVLEFARGVTQSDPEALTDSAFFSVEKVLADPEGLTDAATLAFARAVTAADSEGLTDSAVTELGRLITAADTEGLTDSIAMQVSAAYVDSLGLTDSAQVQLSGSGTLDLSDTEGLSDSAAFAFGKVFADAIGLTDSAQVDLFRLLSLSAADTETLSDTAVLARAGALAPSDSEVLTDQTAFAVSWVKTDDAGLSDVVALQMSTVRSYSDVMGLTDSFTIQLGQQVPDRDLQLAGYLLPGRFSGTIAPGRFAGSLQPGRLKGEVEW